MGALRTSQLVAVALAALGSADAKAALEQTAAKQVPPIATYQVTRASSPIVVDGVLDEPACGPCYQGRNPCAKLTPCT